MTTAESLSVLRLIQWVGQQIDGCKDAASK
jgi:hypothetical protein